MRRFLTCATVLIAASALTLTATAPAKRQVVRVGNLYLADNGGISPSKLPRRGHAPITARLIGEIGTVDGSHPPAVQTVDIEVDRTIRLDAVGAPACRAGRVEARTTDAAREACDSALVGSGRAEVEVAFPESVPFSASGTVLIFNGGVRGQTTTVLLHAYVNVPAPTAIVVRATVTRFHRGRFGLAIAAEIPRIAGGSGSVTKFDLKIGRRFSHRGEEKSLLSASCPTGRWQTRGNVVFSDGTELGLVHAFPCTPEG